MLIARLVVTVLLLALLPAHGQAPKHGGILNAMQAEDLPAGFSIHETSTILGLWPSMPCYSNLVIFDPFKPRETAETILPELAEKWSWQDDYRNLVFFLRRNVRWHDGQPFTAKDVKYTFDMVREAKDAPAKLRLNPRKEWYANIDTIETPDPFTVIFRLRRPQPSLLMMVASGYSPIYPAHVPPAALRAKCIGTGPFRFKEYTPGQVIQLERNPDYFVKDRPYLDGIRYPIIGERGTRMAALQAKQLDVSLPTEITTVMVETLKKTTPALVVTETSHSGSDTVLLNHKRPPFDNVSVRRAVSLALDRNGFIQAVRQGGAFVGSALMSPPFGAWGLPEKEVKALPGYRTAAQDKAEARRLLAAAGIGGAPLKVDLVTRNFAIYIDLASFVADQLKQVGMEAAVRQVDTAAWFPTLARREFQIGANLTAGVVDDPDAYFFENYKCGSPRNYTDYCDERVDRLIDAQSQELDRGKRLKLVWEIQRKLEADVARPMLGWRKEYFTQWPYVKNLVPHNSLYNYGRMQEVWLDK